MGNGRFGLFTFRDILNDAHYLYRPARLFIHHHFDPVANGPNRTVRLIQPVLVCGLVQAVDGLLQRLKSQRPVIGMHMLIEKFFCHLH